MWHLTCGDLAADSVRRLLGAGDEVRVLRDDLAVGPLNDIERPPCSARVAFWESVWPAARDPQPNFQTTLISDASWLAGLASQSRPVTVWHGDSASEQLMLARVAAALEGSTLAFHEIVCGTGDSRVGTRMAVSMHQLPALETLYQPRIVEPARAAVLAGQWRAVVQEKSAIRRWAGGRFLGEGYARIDLELAAACDDDWIPLAQAMATVMARCDGFFATDMFLFWRARELARQGALQLSDGVESRYEKLQVRRISI